MSSHQLFAQGSNSITLYDDDNSADVRYIFFAIRCSVFAKNLDRKLTVMCVAVHGRLWDILRGHEARAWGRAARAGFTRHSDLHFPVKRGQWQLAAFKQLHVRVHSD
jgi:hypothetical protein